MDSRPTLSRISVTVLTEMLGNVQLPVTHPNVEELAMMWATAKRELEAIADWHDSAQPADS